MAKEKQEIDVDLNFDEQPTNDKKQEQEPIMEEQKADTEVDDLLAKMKALDAQALEDAAAGIQPTLAPEIMFMENNIDQEAPTTRKVKIRVSRPHNCHIGGQWYYLTPGKDISVPPDVRDILRNAKGLLEG